ncbi:GDSL-type esterase/lipase family protein [Nevskia ramosa]|uniref:GDSL-type esterase/lipase family protein n=1 Tax=Nevskia ramosa TaxID=64002 RepID=UPI002355B7F7|nr:GDSL-type esterase/lipase family protein [Nevskia ramosa]
MRYPLLLVLAMTLLSPPVGARPEQRQASMSMLPQPEIIQTVFKPGDLVLAIGDSLVAGSGVRPKETFPALLEEWTPAQVFNLGKKGETSTELMRRFEGRVKERTYRWVLICTGGNDILRDQSMAVLGKNLKDMIAIARRYNSFPVLLAIPDPKTRIDRPIYLEVAKETRTPIISGIGAKLTENNFQADRVHPNREGYKIITTEIMTFFKARPVTAPAAKDNAIR